MDSSAFDAHRQELAQHDQQTISTSQGGNPAPKSDPVPASSNLGGHAAEEFPANNTVPKDPSPPRRNEQDTQSMDGDTVTHLPEETEMADRQPIQG